MHPLRCPVIHNNEESDNPDEKGCYYHEYLQLDKILTAQHRESEKAGYPAHDEHLFIVIHQAYELWFKQIIFELDSCITLMSNNPIPEEDLMTAVHRLTRITKIQGLLVPQMSILETMTPLDFLEFRKYLTPASGFQSVQFRLLENRLGLVGSKRHKYNQKTYDEALRSEHSRIVKECENEVTLFQVLQDWLERCPFVHIQQSESHNTSSPHGLDAKQLEEWNFWDEYNKSVEDMLRHECTTAEEQQGTREIFNAILTEECYADLLSRRKVQLSHRAFKAALMIMLYRDEPLFQMPFTLIQRIMDMDSLLTQWRHTHAALVQRMLGTKMGTGGSSGYFYLRTAAVNHRVFQDFFSMSTYMIPRNYLPKLPGHVRTDLQFRKSFSAEPPVLASLVDDGLGNHANADIIRAFSKDGSW